MKVCIEQRQEYHSEVSVAIAHALIRLVPNVEIVFYAKKYDLDCIGLFVEQYPEQTSVKWNYHRYFEGFDAVIYTTHTDCAESFRNNVRYNVIRIMHLALAKESQILKQDMGLIAAVCPQRFATLCVTWKPIVSNFAIQKPCVVIIGMSRNYSYHKKDVDELSFLIQNNIHVHIISRNVSDELPKKHSQITYHNNMLQKDVVSFLQTQNCILWPACKQDSDYYTKRMTGAIPAAISCNVPIVMHSELHKLYDGIPALLYGKSIQEVIPELQTFQRNEDLIYAEFIQKQDMRFLEILKKNNFV